MGYVPGGHLIGCASRQHLLRRAPRHPLRHRDPRDRAGVRRGAGRIGGAHPRADRAPAKPNTTGTIARSTIIYFPMEARADTRSPTSVWIEAPSRSARSSTATPPPSRGHDPPADPAGARCPAPDRRTDRHRESSSRRRCPGVRTECGRRDSNPHGSLHRDLNHASMILAARAEVTVPGEVSSAAR